MVDKETIFIKVTDLIPFPGSGWGNYEHMCQFTLILKTHTVSRNKCTFLRSLVKCAGLLMSDSEPFCS